MTQNGLTEESIIYEGQELLIVPASQAAQETPQGTQTPEEAAPSATPSPTFTPTQQPTRTQQAPTPKRTP